MMTVLAILVALIMSLVALLHFYWALGGRFGVDSATPRLEGRSDFKPGPVLTFVVACLISWLAVLAIQLRWPWQPVREFVPYAGYAVSVVLFARGVGDFRYVGLFKKVYNSHFARRDTRYFSPLIILLGLAYGVLSAHGA